MAFANQLASAGPLVLTKPTPNIVAIAALCTSSIVAVAEPSLQPYRFQHPLGFKLLSYRHITSVFAFLIINNIVPATALIILALFLLLTLPLFATLDPSLDPSIPYTKSVLDPFLESVIVLNPRIRKIPR